jgi:hypothetical protein
MKNIKPCVSAKVKYIKQVTASIALECTTLMASKLHVDTSGREWYYCHHSIPGVFSGEHMFCFLESKTTKDGTTLLHEEKFTGLLVVLLPESQHQINLALKPTITGPLR